MNVVVTGANGFLGRHVVKSALDAGHTVRAVVRPATTSFDSAGEERLEVVRADLRSSSLDPGMLTDADVVIHLAAAKSGSFSEQFAGTVVATENLLRIMEPAKVPLIGMSSFSVYDHRSTPAGATIDERTPIDPSPKSRDEYAQTKIVQESLYRGYRDDVGAPVTIVRPGMIYGAGCLWHALVGIELGNVMIQVGRDAALPLTYVGNCADAIVAAADRLVAPVGGAPEIVCVVDDDPPTVGEYVAVVAEATGDESPRRIPVPWKAVRAAASIVEAVNQRGFSGGLKLPGFVVPDRLDARFKPFAYSNSVAHDALGWRPRVSLTEAVRRSVSDPVPFERAFESV